METPDPLVRFRVNVGVTSTGKYTWDATAEITAPIIAMHGDLKKVDLALKGLQLMVENASLRLTNNLRDRYGRGDLD